ncbi:MAG: hypothetical protein ACJAZ2_000003 [Glaciecola sp.]|jgi:hypothetical protein
MKRIINRSRLSIAFCLVMVLFSCEKEYEKHCQNQGVRGEICKELRYENDVLVEAVTYEYGNNSLVYLKLHENKNGSNIGQVIYTYDGQNTLVSETFKNSKQEEVILSTWSYNAQQQEESNVSTVYGVKQETKTTYDTNWVIQEKIYIDEVLKYNKVYQYFDNDTMSFNVFTYDQDSVLLTVAEHRQFDSTTKRIEVYNQSGGLDNYYVHLYQSSGELIEKRTYDKNSTLIHQELYYYDNGKVDEYKLQSTATANKKIKYLRF